VLSTMCCLALNFMCSKAEADSATECKANSPALARFVSRERMNFCLSDRIIRDCNSHVHIIMAAYGFYSGC
jgi:hypothetical protein